MQCSKVHCIIVLQVDRAAAASSAPVARPWGPDAVGIQHRMLMQVLDAEGKLGSKRCKRFSAVIADNVFKVRHAYTALSM